MPAKFNAGQSMKTTETTRQFGAKPSRAPDGNTMKGMRGSINTGQKRDSSDTLNGKGFGPKREGPIGRHTGAAHGKDGASQATGSMDKSYRATSTAKPGKVMSQSTVPSGAGKMESLRGRAKTSWER
jgi:hypothetical protein